jgi:probable F420-dependent oxidoreductase
MTRPIEGSTRGPIKFSARLEVGLFDVVERGRALAGAYPSEPGRASALHSPGLAEVAAQARGLETAGFDGVYTIEAAHDVFFPLVLAAQATGLELMTDLAVAFPRSPMHLAHQAYDLQLLSRGRFTLGLGTQVPQVNERYYSTPWDRPVARLRDLVLALRAIWRCWQEGEPLRHEGPFYRHSFMNPAFNPGPNPYGVPPVLIGALGPQMTRMTAEVADGVLLHPFTTERFIRQRTLPSLQAGFLAGGRDGSDFEVVSMVMISTGRDDRELAVADAGVKALIAFYGSTPAYRPLLELEGLLDLHAELQRLAREGRWDAMAGAIDPDVLSRFAVRGSPDEVGAEVARRYGGVATRINTYLPYAAGLDLQTDLAKALHAGAEARA